MSDDRAAADEMLDALGLDEDEKDALTADVETKDDIQEQMDEESGPTINSSEQGRCSCRYCQQDFREAARAREHLNWCAAAPEELQDDAHDIQDDVDDEDDLLDDFDDDQATSEDPGYLIKPAPHEFRAFLKYGKAGLDPYYALHAKRKSYDDWDDGGPTAEYEHHGRNFEVELTYNPDNPILPWDDDEFRIEEVYEYRINVSGPEDHRHFSAKISPRWPDMQTEEGSATISNPRDFVGLDIDVQGSNIPFDEYPQHIEAAMQALDIAGEYQDNDRTYYDPSFIEDWSTIIDAELYVRVDKDQSGPVYAIDGPLERISMLLADDRSGYRKRIADDTETEGYYHVATIGSKRSRQLISGHRLGKEIKHYHVENPEAVAGDEMLEHPKVGVSLQNSITDSTLYWDDLDHLQRELDETLMNVLKWAGLSTSPRHDLYVEDAVFEIDASRRDRNLIPNPLPAIQSEQDTRVIRQLDNMTESDKDVVGTVLTDGGEISPQEVAERTGWSYDTVIASLHRLDDVVEHSYGEISLKSKHIAQQLVDHVSAIRDGVESQLESIGQQLQRAISGLEDPDNPFRRWAEQYGIDVEDHDEDPRIIMRMGYLPTDASELDEIIQEGRAALRRTLGEQAADESRIARWGEIQTTLQNGQAVRHLGFG